MICIIAAMSKARWAPRVTVAAVIEQDGRYLLVEEHTSAGLRLNTPAGHLEPGETAEQAADTLRQIKDGAQSTLDRVREVAESTKEQSVASDSIAQKVEEIATMVEETTAAMHATAQTVEDLERISGELNALVSRFRC